MADEKLQDDARDARWPATLKRWLSWVVAALFVLVPSWVLVEHYQGKSVLDRALAEEDARRETLLRKWAPEVSLESVSNGWPALVALYPRLTNLARMRPPAMLPVAPGRAIAGHQLEWWGLNRDAGTSSWAAFGPMLESRREDIEGVHRALALPVRQAPVKASDADEDGRGAVLRVFRGAGAVVESAGLLALREGDVAGALRAVAALGVLEQDLARRPTWGGHRMRRMDAVSAANLRTAILHSGRATEEQLKELTPKPVGLRRVRDLTQVRELSRARVIRMYRAMSYSDLRATLGNRWTRMTAAEVEAEAAAARSERTGFGAYVAEGGQAWQQLRRSLRDDLVFPVWRFGWGDLALAQCLKDWNSWEEETSEAAARRSWAALTAGEIWPAPEPENFRERWASFLSPEMRGLELEHYKQVFQLELHESMNAAAIALRRHELRHGKLPDTLSALVPEFLPEVPVDWMTGKPLRYQRGEGGEFLLQSVGFNLRDDSVAPVDVRDLFAHAGGDDEVWPLPVSEESRVRHQRGEAERRVRLGGMDPSLARRYGLLPPAGVETNRAATRATGAATPGGGNGGR